MKVVKVTKETKEKNLVGYSLVEVKDYQAIDGENLFSYSFILDSFRKIMGRTLTLLDSSIENPTKNKAMKDIVRNIFSDEMDFTAEMGFDQEKLNKIAEEALENNTGEIRDGVSIEEALGVQ